LKTSLALNGRSGDDYRRHSTGAALCDLDDNELLDQLQRSAFHYFQNNFNPANGLIADTTRVGAPASIAVAGFALAAYPIAVERGWMTRAEAVARTLAALRFFLERPTTRRRECGRL
jgi:hypothetical protein